MRNHHLSALHFEALAAGYGDVDVVAALSRAQLSKRLLQLRAVLDAAASAHPDARIEAPFELLSAVQESAPEAYTATLAEPHVGAWLAHCLRRVRGSVTGDEPIRKDLGHLATIAATAATRAGLEFELAVPVRAGAVVLPGLGQATVNAGLDWAPVSSDGKILTVAGIAVPDEPDAEVPGWQELRFLEAHSAGLSIRVRLDDLDPFRDLHRLCAADRLDPDTVEQWRRHFNDCWDIVVTHHRRYAEAIAAGLVTLVPLAAQRSTRGVNATSMDAFGSISLSSPADGQAFAAALIHEFQHAKLGALMDLLALHEPIEEGRYYAPWRDDPRPLGALLHGAYAFLAVADFWRVQRNVLGPDRSRFAHFEFARWRERVSRVMDVLMSAGELTPTGRRFVEGMRATHAPWWDEPVPAESTQLASNAAEDHWIGWRLRNRRPHPESIRELAAAWLEGGCASPRTVPTETVDRDRTLVHNVRLDLTGLRISDPERFARLCADPAELAATVPGVTAGDAAYARADYADAVTLYRKEISAEPDSIEAWIGLALAQHNLHPGRQSSLRSCPEVVYAVHQQARASSGVSADPEILADWLAPLTISGGS